jgi:hypothetical protein
MTQKTAKTRVLADAKRTYALRRMMTALDRVIAGQTKEQRKKDVAWASLWHKYWKTLSSQAK